MRLFRIFFLILVGLTAVSCSFTPNNTLPTPVPTANVPAGPAGTNALTLPFQLQENPAIGLQIEHPQDWEGASLSDGIRLIPLPVSTSTEYSLSVTAVSLINLPDVDPNSSIVAALEAVITNPDLGPPESITRIVEPTAVSVNNYTGAVAQIQVVPPDLTPIEGDADLAGNVALSTPDNLHLYFVALRHGERTVLFSGTTSADTANIYIPIFETMADTIQTTDIPADESG